MSQHAEPKGPAIETINPPGLYDPSGNGYSHVVIARNTGTLIHIAGQGGEDASGTLDPDFDRQVTQAFDNLLTALQAAGVAPTQVVKLNTYPVEYDQTKLSAITREVLRAFPDAAPAQTLIPVPRLALDGMLFEVDAVAVV